MDSVVARVWRYYTPSLETFESLDEALAMHDFYIDEGTAAMEWLYDSQTGLLLWGKVLWMAAFSRHNKGVNKAWQST